MKVCYCLPSSSSIPIPFSFLLSLIKNKKYKKKKECRDREKWSIHNLDFSLLLELTGFKQDLEVKKNKWLQPY